MLKHRAIILATGLFSLMVFSLFLLSTMQMSPRAIAGALEPQETIDAIVSQYFTQTADAVLVATAQAVFEDAVMATADSNYIREYGHLTIQEKFEMFGWIPSFTLNGHTGGIYDVALSPDNSRLAVGSNNGAVSLWNLNNRQLQAMLGNKTSFTSVAFSPDSRILASFGKLNRSVQLWRAINGSAITTLQHPRWVTSMAFSNDSRTIATGSKDGIVRLWNTTTGILLTEFEGHTDFISDIIFDSSDTVLFTASGDHDIRLWGLYPRENLDVIDDWHTEAVYDITLSPEDRFFASGGADGEVNVWNVEGRSVSWLSTAFDSTTRLAFSPDNSFLAVGSDGNDFKSLQIVDIQNEQLLPRLRGHTGVVTGFAFSPDSTILASGSQDSTVRLWNARTGTMITTLRGHDGVRGVADLVFSSDGSFLISAGRDDNVITVWGLPR